MAMKVNQVDPDDLQADIEILKAEHAALERQLRLVHYDDIESMKIKKQKLWVKDAIARLELRISLLPVVPVNDSDYAPVAMAI